MDNNPYSSPSCVSHNPSDWSLAKRIAKAVAAIVVCLAACDCLIMWKMFRDTQPGTPTINQAVSFFTDWRRDAVKD